MSRAILELLIIIVLVVGARSILTSLFRGFAGSAGSRSSRSPRGADQVPAGGELHKDPVCGTYVAESTVFRQVLGSQTFYYCSAECRDRHGIAAKAG